MHLAQLIALCLAAGLQHLAAVALWTAQAPAALTWTLMRSLPRYTDDLNKVYSPGPAVSMLEFNAQQPAACSRRCQRLQIASTIPAVSHSCLAAPICVSGRLRQ